jgi:hypothetical protein
VACFFSSDIASVLRDKFDGVLPRSVINLINSPF